MSAHTVSYVEAAGGIIYRQRTDTITSANPSTSSNSANCLELCLVYRPKYDDWSWPKGKLEANESHRHAAVREVGEETGYSVSLGPHLLEIYYNLNAEGKNTPFATSGSAKNIKSITDDKGTIAIKHIHYWIMRIANEHYAHTFDQALWPIERASLHEISNMAWLTPDEARKRLTHDSDRAVLDAFLQRFRQHQLDYRTLLLVRHGQAIARKAWTGQESHRPLSPQGAAQSYALDKELACYQPTKLISSPWKRCLQTINAFADDTTLPIHSVEALSEEAFANVPRETLDVIQNTLSQLFASDQADNALLCLHRPIIGAYFEYLRTLTLPHAHKRILRTKTPYMPTGCAVALHIIKDNEHIHIIDIEKVKPIVY